LAVTGEPSGTESATVTNVSLPAKKVEAPGNSALRTRSFAWRLCVGVIVGIALLLVLINWHSDEPRYQGKPLSLWMDELTAMPRDIDESRFWPAYQRQLGTLTNVVRSIGTNGLPCYLDWIEHPPPDDSWYEQATDWIAQISSYHIRLPERPDHSSEGVFAIQILGPDARTAIPVLGRLLDSESSCGAASYCLSAVGPEAIPTLTNVLERSTNTYVRYSAVRALGDFGTAALPVKAALLTVVREEKPNSWPGVSTADLALRALAEMAISPEELMPLFTEQLFATNASAGAAYGLARLGPIGTPVLLSALTNEDRKIRTASETGLDFQKYLQTNPQKDAFLLFERFDSKFNQKFNQNLFRAGPIP
jgi:PBS lyase HEAT-like repeat